jgi:hypothetical protein
MFTGGPPEGAVDEEGLVTGFGQKSGSFDGSFLKREQQANFGSYPLWCCYSKKLPFLQVAMLTGGPPEGAVDAVGFGQKSGSSDGSFLKREQHFILAGSPCACTNSHILPFLQVPVFTGRLLDNVDY